MVQQKGCQHYRMHKQRMCEYLDLQREHLHRMFQLLYQVVSYLGIFYILSVRYYPTKQTTITALLSHHKLLQDPSGLLAEFYQYW